MIYSNVKYCSLLLLLIVSISCGKPYNALEKSLAFAGENRSELEKVLTYYSCDKKDSLKLKAARFLIENMPGYYSVQSPEIDSIKKRISIGLKNKIPAGQILDTIRNRQPYSKEKPQIIYDSHVITAGYLIQNIEWAFKVKDEQPWGAYISFIDFCEYVLPYRIGNEPLENWREIYYKEYQSLLDTMLTGSDVVEACQIINKANFDKSWQFIGWESIGNFPHFGADFLFENRIGPCVEMADLNIYALRAVGIPAGIDYLKLRPGGFTSHYWNFAIDTTGVSFDFAPFDAHPERGNFRTSFEQKGKVYRQTFSRQTNRLLQYKTIDEIPPTLQSEYETDVSNLYFPINRISFNCTNPIAGENIVYLCLFNNSEWMPVAWTEICNGEAVFPYVDCRNIAYLAAYFRHGKIIPFSDPLVVRESFLAKSISLDTIRKQTVKVFRKFPSDRVNFFHDLMLHGKFQGANKRDFSDATTLAEITESPQGFAYAFSKDTLSSFRYIRYFSSRLRGDVAEIEVYGADSILTGKPFGNPPYAYMDEYAPKKAFDGDLLTSFVSEYEKDAWVGLDLGKRERIQKIRYIPRSDDNSIRLYDEYELFYLSYHGWVSLGRQAATSWFLDFENAPASALFWLRDLTRGREERIFTYEDGQQIWW